MMFDVWRDMFMVRMGTGQGRVIRMLLGIVPIKLLLTLPHFIAIIHNSTRVSSKGELLTGHQAVTTDFYITGQYGNGRTTTYNSKRGTLNDQILLRQRVNELLVFTKRLQGIHGGLSGQLNRRL